MTKVVFALMPESSQVFVKGRRPVWQRWFLPLMPEFGQVFVKVGGLFGQGCFFALMPESGQVFVKGRRPVWPR